MSMKIGEFKSEGLTKAVENILDTFSGADGGGSFVMFLQHAWKATRSKMKKYLNSKARQCTHVIVMNNKTGKAEAILKIAPPQLATLRSAWAKERLKAFPEEGGQSSGTDTDAGDRHDQHEQRGV